MNENSPTASGEAGKVEAWRADEIILCRTARPSKDLPAHAYVVIGYRNGEVRRRIYVSRKGAAARTRYLQQDGWRVERFSFLVHEAKKMNGLKP